MTHRTVSRGIATGRVDKLAHLREIGLVLGAYGIYILARNVLASEGVQKGFANAVKVIQWEKALGLFWEPTVQQWGFHAGKGFLLVFNYLYVVIWWPVILGTAVILYFLDHSRYTYYRTLILLSFVVALVIFAAFPVAPPRMMRSDGLIDTIVLFGPRIYDSGQSAYFNAFAAMPSLHFGWTIAYGFLFWGTGIRWLRVIAILYPVMMFVTIVITGNHYVVDAITGALLMLVVLLLYQLVFRQSRFRQRAVSLFRSVRDRTF